MAPAAHTGSSRCRSRRGSMPSAWRASRHGTTRRRRACRSRCGCSRRTPRQASESSISPDAAPSTSSASRSARTRTRSSPTCRPPASAAAPSTPRVIFYGEKGVASGSAPVVHEVAHQWWGNAVTERDWDDVWLSEGFATYFTLLYTEQFDGRDAFVRGLAQQPGPHPAAREEDAGHADHPSQPVRHAPRAEPVRLPEGRLDAAHAPLPHGDGALLGRDPRVLPALPESERVDRRFPLRDGSASPARTCAGSSISG